MNILVTIDKNYLNHLITLLLSIKVSNQEEQFNIYILHRNLTHQDIKEINKIINSNRFNIKPIKIKEKETRKFPVFEKRYPTEIYFRIFAPKYLPKNIKKILYLDTDIIVINKLEELYNMEFDNNYFIASTHIKKTIHKFHEIRLGLNKNDAYINTGVLLMNIEQLRKIPLEKQVREFVDNNRKKLMLPDQDIISALYGDKVKLIDEMKYNLGERALISYNLTHPTKKKDLDWIRGNTIIIHYYGRNKPWNKKYIGRLDYFYKQVENFVNFRT